MLKLFVTGDNHIGLKYANYEKSDYIRAKRIHALTQMVSKANEEECALFAITGDLFENTYGIARKDVKTVMDILGDFQGIVLILPGNHDYYDKEVKLWQYAEDVVKEKDNILLLTEYRPYALQVKEESVVVYPALCTTLHSRPGENKLAWIKEAQVTPDEVYRIGMAHGAVEGETIDREGQYFLMKREELMELPVDVWLLGHTHVPFPANLTEEYAACEKLLNAGTHVQTDVSCHTPGLCFMVEITEDKELRAKKYISGNIGFYRKQIELEAEKMEEILERELADIPSDSVVDILLTGAVSPQEYESRHSIMEKALSRFVEADYSDHELSKLISEELIAAEFAETSFSAGLLKALLEEPKEAQLAYELLASLRNR